MKIYKLKKDFRHGLGNGERIAIDLSNKKGERFFKPTDKSEYSTIGPDYFPENGSYPISEREDFKFVDEFLEFIEETDKPKEYYLHKKYTQEQVDKMLNKK